MTRLLLTAAVTFSCASAFGQGTSYLCIAERFAAAMRPFTLESSSTFSSWGNESEQKFILNNQGLSEFGSNFPVLDFCFTANNGTITCESTSGFSGWFQKSPSNLFELVQVASSDSQVGLLTHVGRCSKI